MNKKRRLLAKPYIINNKTRVLVLVVSFSLFITMLYSISFLFSITTETFHSLIVERFEHTAIITFNLPENASFDEYEKCCLETCKILSNQTGVEAALPSASYYDGHINAVIGHMRFDASLMKAENLPIFLDQYHATLVKGKLPNKPGELVINERYQKNNEVNIGDTMIEDFTIVGIVKSDSYLVAGINRGDFSERNCMVFLEPNADIYEICKNSSIPYDYNLSSIQEAKVEYDKDVDSTISFSTDLITIISTTLLFICLLVVMQMHFRDRQEEWCLYNSIGYSMWNIYCLAMKELLFTLAIGAFIGGLLSTAFMIIVNALIVAPKGLMVHFFIPDTVLTTLSIMILFIGFCQLPLMRSLHQVRTVDALESESN